MIYHLALVTDLEAARVGGSYRVSSLGRTLDDEGFIHASYPGQVAGVGERYYRDVREPLVLLVIDEARLGVPVRVEGGFPHVYGPIILDAVVEERPVSREPDGTLRFAGLE